MDIARANAASLELTASIDSRDGSVYACRMGKKAIFGAIAVAFAVWMFIGRDAGVSTLYRNSVAGGIDDPVSIRQRLHVATFDSTDGGAYNWENCLTAQGLFQAQPGTKVKFWCEKGRFHE